MPWYRDRTAENPVGRTGGLPYMCNQPCAHSTLDGNSPYFQVLQQQPWSVSFIYQRSQVLRPHRETYTSSKLDNHEHEDQLVGYGRDSKTSASTKTIFTAMENRSVVFIENYFRLLTNTRHGDNWSKRQTGFPSVFGGHTAFTFLS